MTEPEISKENTIAIDFDETIMEKERITTAFTSNPLISKPIAGAIQTIKELDGLGYRVVIFSCRAIDKTGRTQIANWLKDFECDKYISEITAIKPFAFAYIDDRAVAFKNWEEARVNVMLMELR